MAHRYSKISLDELTAAGVRMQHADAVAIAREMALRAARGELPGLPAVHSIRLSSDGAIQIEGPIAIGCDVPSAGRLLEALMDQASDEVSVPEAFRTIVLRAYARDEAPFSSLEEFAGALTPFAAPDASEVARGLVGVANALAALESAEESDTTAARHEVAELHAAPEPSPSLIPPADQVAETLDASLDLSQSNTESPRGSNILLRPVRDRRRPATSEPSPILIPKADWVVETVDMSLGLSEFNSESLGGSDIRLKPARDRRRPVVSGSDVRLRPARDRRRPVVRRPSEGFIRAAAIAMLASATLVLGARCYFVYQRQESAAIQGGSGISSPAASASSTASVTPSATVSAVTDQRDAPATSSSAAVGGAPRLSRPPAATWKQRPFVSATQILPTAAFSPSFAAAMPAMFYHSGSGSRSAIRRADIGSDNKILRVTELVDDVSSNFHPRPSPDGRSIAFDSDRDGERGVYLADVNGRGARRISGDGFAAVPSWSPDGRQVAFVRAERGRPRVWNIWIVDVATGVMRRITSHPFGQPWGAVWFPEGDRIAYSHEDRLIVRSLSGDSVRVFKSPIRGRLVRTPAISPDGRRIVFQVRRDGAWMLDLATGKTRRILADPSAEEFSWSAGGRVAYHSRRSGNWGVWMTAPL